LALSPQALDERRGGRGVLDRSGVWRFRELILPLEERYLAARPEGNTGLYESARLSAWTGAQGLRLKHEGENPTGSFKDRGMTAGVSAARALGMERVAVASTGNTSASAAAYAARFGLGCVVFLPEGEISYGKLAQALAYGAQVVQIAGDFDDAMRLVEEVCGEEGIYLLNSINPFRIEGQKAIGFELLQDLGWEVPDWIVLPGGNLGNSSAIMKGLLELRGLGWISKLPRVAVIQAAGAAPLWEAWRGDKVLRPWKAKTLASAIQIGNPVSFARCVEGLEVFGGVVEVATDQEIMDAKAQVDASGIGAEPASCATVAGVKKLVEAGVIGAEEVVCGVLTGHVLKDPDAVVKYHTGALSGVASRYANQTHRAEAGLASVLRAVRGTGG
jgi:threonine synthase